MTARLELAIRRSLTGPTGKAARKVAAAGAIAIAIAIACTTAPLPSPSQTASVHLSSPAPRSSAPEAVQFDRPLALPTLAPNGICPVSPWVDIGSLHAPPDFGRPGAFFVLGSGPLYPILHDFDEGSGALRYGSFATSVGPPFINFRWSKIRWILSPGHTGPILLRGRQLDAARVVRFHQPELLWLEMAPALLLEVSAGEQRWRHFAGNGFISVPGPGCYAIQVDGPSWSRAIVFRVVE